MIDLAWHVAELVREDMVAPKRDALDEGRAGEAPPQPCEMRRGQERRDAAVEVAHD